MSVIGISLATNNVGVVLSFKGSCLSSLVVYIIPGLAYIKLMQPSGFKALFGPWLLIVYGTGAGAPAQKLCELRPYGCCVALFLTLFVFICAVYGIVGTYYAAYNLSQAHH
jgi:hypothetical protein